MQRISVGPQTAKDSYGPTDQISFKLPGFGTLEGSSASLAFDLEVSNGAGADLAATDVTTLSVQAGAWSTIQIMRVSAGNQALEVNDDVGRWCTAYNAMSASAARSTVSAMRGTLELSAAYIHSAYLNTTGCVTDPQPVALSHSKALGIFSADIPLSDVGGLTLNISLADRVRALKSGVAAATFAIRNIRLVARVHPPNIKPLRPLATNFSSVLTLSAYLSTSNASLRFNPVSSTFCTGVVFTFLANAKAADIAQDAFALDLPSTITEASLEVGGRKFPIAYTIRPVGTNSDTMGYTELFQLALSGAAGSNATAVMAGDGDFLPSGSEHQAVALGFPLGGLNLAQQEVTLNLTSGASSAAPFIVYAHFIQMSAL